MRIILLLTVLGTVMVAVGLLGLYASVTVRLNRLEHELKNSRRDIRKNHNEIHILKNRAADESDHIVITREWKDAGDIRYPSQEV